MPLSLNEIKQRAFTFSNYWKDESKERAEKDTFWNEFFHIFGIDRKRVAVFEQTAKRYGNKKGGFIDVFWKGLLLCEHKSKGKDLDSAYQQATDYFEGLKDHELPRYIIVSDFERFRFTDLNENLTVEFKTEELPSKLELFTFLSGYKKTTYREEDKANIQAAELMGKLHDSLFDAGYRDHPLEIFLVRILFTLFAEDTGIFEKATFTDYIINRTNEDGSDLGMHLSQIFQILNTPNDKRYSNLDEDLARFSYINGGLFAEPILIPSFDSKMRETLLDACYFDWSGISPAIFGSLFQYVMDKDKRRSFGAHYTEEKIILRTIQPLFLDNLWTEFEKVKKNKAKLNEFHEKLSKLKFFDPACGCGNFLVITYREIRKLELEILKIQFQSEQLFEISSLIKVDVDQFYGIEIEEFPAKIAETALWLMDHIANIEASKDLGQYYARIPLKKQATIVHGNALQTSWEEVLNGNYSPKGNLAGLENLQTETVEYNWKQDQIYIIGNPPFVGSKLQSKEQRQEMAEIFRGVKGSGVMDYVSAWYLKAGELIKINPKIETAFVSTNSISQGEQVGILWGEMFRQFNAEIKFAHQSFSWTSEARGKAQVTVIIIGFRKEEITPSKWSNSESLGVSSKTLFTYPDIKGEPTAKTVKNINPYLVEADNVVIKNISKPICNVQEMGIGNKPIDGGNYLFEKEEMLEFVSKEPLSEKYFKPWIGAKEYFNGIPRYVLLLKDVNPAELRKMPLVLDRIEKVKQFRLASSSKPTQKLAQTPTRFHVENFPEGNSIIVPEVNSVTREYIPIGFIDNQTICSNLVKLVPNTTLYHFGILQSRMHMAWTKYVCGRLGNAIRYSSGVVYNNFPWSGVDGECDNIPRSSSDPLKGVSLKNDKLKTKIEECAKEVLEVRANFENASLADLYDPLAMPPELTKAHQKLDKAVDEAYRRGGFKDDVERVEWLFEGYKNFNS